MFRAIVVIMLMAGVPVLAGGTQAALGQCQANEAARITASDGSAVDYFGESVATSGDVIVVGAPGEDGFGANSGAAYVYRFTGAVWAEESKLVATDSGAGDAFGMSVSIDSDVIVVGSPGDDVSDAHFGSAFVYRFDGSTWVQEAKLTASDAAFGDYFGDSVSINGDVVVVGAPGDDNGGSNSGSAYVYGYAGAVWTEDALLTASDSAVNDYFGDSVSISGDVVVVGAPEHDDAASNSGSAYLFEKPVTGWVAMTETAQLTASDASQDDKFGFSVSISGDVSVIAAPYDDDSGDDSGSAYVFQKPPTGWVSMNEICKLSASDGATQDLFSFSVSVSNDLVVIGAVRHNGSSEDSGSAYLFQKPPTGWLAMTETGGFSASDGAAFDLLGHSVCVGGGLAVVGAIGDDGNAANSGSVYVFAGLSDCNTNGVLDVCDISASTSPDCSGNGIPDECEPDCNSNGSPDSCDILVGTSQDCNVNGVPDECDLTSGVSPDCNTNGIPDECDIVSGASQDCQPNGVPDECDIADGTSADNNVNGIPDECETAICYGVETAKITASDGSVNDQFGNSVSMSGDFSIVGAWLDDGTASNAGAAYVYEWQGGDSFVETKLTASDGAVGDKFGFSVCVSGDVIVVGAPEDADDGSASGSAYVYRRGSDGWFEETKLTASDADVRDRFGESVSISGDVIVVGAPGDNDFINDSGSAYLYRSHSGVWFEEAKFTASDPQSDCELGGSVSISGDWVVVGARYHDGLGYASGAAYCFQKPPGGWVTMTESARLVASDGADNDYFGQAVCVSSSVFVAGAPYDDDNGINSGSAYVFQYDSGSWSEAAKLLPTDGAAGDRFGEESVSISGNVVCIGARLNDDSGSHSGSAYVFTEPATGWAPMTETVRIRPSDGAADDWFGSSVAVGDGGAVVGAYRSSGTGGSRTGAAYVYAGIADCNANSFLDICDLDVGTSLDCNANGIPDECEPFDDCNGNGLQDFCDIAGGFSLDCNGNAIPDECDIATGTSLDCTGNNVPDECEPDCNNNGTADSCDILSGSSLDCNGNGVPDECDLTAGSSQDCNYNGVPDECETDCNGNNIPDECDIASGSSADCDGDEIPDECETLFFTAASPQLGPIGDGMPQTHTVTSPPLAGVEVVLTFQVVGDFGALLEWVDVDINGVSIGQVFMQNAHDCPAQPDLDTLTVPGNVYSAAVGGGDAVIGMVASSLVNPNLCPQSFIVVTLEYQAVTPDDCNANGLPDLCDIWLGNSLDVNGNGIPDECEVGLGDLNCDGVVDVGDIPFFVQALTDPGSFTGCDIGRADVNVDGTADGGDIQAFAGCVLLGVCP